MLLEAFSLYLARDRGRESIEIVFTGRSRGGKKKENEGGLREGNEKRVKERCGFLFLVVG